MAAKEVEPSKLEREAEAAGLVLLGPGKNKNYRAYRWRSCGHESQYEPGNVRKGRVRCQLCLDQDLVNEATNVGLVLLGPGKDSACRTYRWYSCGHVAQYKTPKVRRGSVRCQECFNKRLHDDASAAGLLLVGRAKSPSSRTYRWIACGHEAEYRPDGVRNHEVSCKQCFEIKLRNEAEAVGLVLVGSGKNCNYRTYRLQSCEHEAEYGTSKVRTGSVRCKVCFNQNLHDEALSAGLDLIGPGRNSKYSIYRWHSCGHELEYRTDKVRTESIRCQQCLDDKLAAEADSAGLLLIASGRGNRYRKYRWKSCGHEAEYHTFAVRVGSVCCQACDATAWSKPSTIYLLHFASDDGTNWLKLGVAKNIGTRIKEYRLFDGVRLIERLASIPANTGKEATVVEKALHNHFREHRIHPGQMKDYMSKSGHTECYPMSMRDKLLEAINALALNAADTSL